MKIFTVIICGIFMGAVFTALVEGWFRLFRSYPARMVAEFQRRKEKLVPSKNRWIVVPATFCFGAAMFLGLQYYQRSVASSSKTAEAKKQKAEEILIPTIELLGPNNPAEYTSEEIRSLLAKSKVFVPSSLDFDKVDVEFWGRDWNKMGIEGRLERRKITALKSIPKWAEKVRFYGPPGTKIRFRPSEKTADSKPPPNVK